MEVKTIGWEYGNNSTFGYMVLKTMELNTNLKLKVPHCMGNNHCLWSMVVITIAYGFVVLITKVSSLGL